MDFIKKKAFEAQINKVGKDLGLGSNITSSITGGGSSQQREQQSHWSVFPSRREERDVEAQEENESPAPAPAVTFYDVKPKNFPPCVKLFYIDHGILSDATATPLLFVYRVFYCLEALLALNIVTGITVTIFYGGNKWIDLVLGIVMAALLTIFELVAYDTAFRGAYRNSTNLRRRYLLFATATIVLIAMYAFFGWAFFNGWAKLEGIGKGDKSSDTQKRVERGLVIVEAVGWTLLSLLNMYTLFEYYHLYKSKEQGLSSEAMASTSERNGNIDNDEITAEEPNRGARRDGRTSRDARIQEIRDRYRTET